MEIFPSSRNTELQKVLIFRLPADFHVLQRHLVAKWRTDAGPDTIKHLYSNLEDLFILFNQKLNWVHFYADDRIITICRQIFRCEGDNIKCVWLFFFSSGDCATGFQFMKQFSHTNTHQKWNFHIIFFIITHALPVLRHIFYGWFMLLLCSDTPAGWCGNSCYMKHTLKRTSNASWANPEWEPCRLDYTHGYCANMETDTAA